jgi:hypothetical protein
LALDMHAMLLGVICHDENDSADIQYLKDIERNTKHVQHHGE